MFFVILTLLFGITGFFGVGFGPIPIVQTFFYIFLVVTIVIYLMERGKKKKRFF